MNFWEFRKLEFERRDKQLQHAIPMQLKKTNEKKPLLHIVYVMTWVGLCGGSKIILQHANYLVERGHAVTIICHFAKPSWFTLDKKVCFTHVPMGEILCEHIPPCDVIVATYWKEIYECTAQNIAPVVYFEQGDTHLFKPQSMDVRTLSHIRKQIAVAPFVFTVSSFAQEKLMEHFNKKSHVIPNAVDKAIFFPKARQEINVDEDKKIVITAIGSENIAFKNITNIVVAVTLLKKLGHPIEFIWISPDAPQKLTTIPVNINPNQSVIGECLRRTDIYVCASNYESFCLPVLEAMTCGAAVITTDNGGIRDFVKDHVNALLIEKNNIADIMAKIEDLISQPNKRQQLAHEGLKTAEAFSWARTTDDLTCYYQDIARYTIENKQ